MNRYVRPSSPWRSLEQVDDLRLNRDVESGHGLVADDELRIHCERAREADALALPAGELVGKAIRCVRRQSDDLEQFADTRPDLLS